jgi:hypothetical protein
MSPEDRGLRSEHGHEQHERQHADGQAQEDPLPRKGGRWAGGSVRVVGMDETSTHRWGLGGGPPVRFGTAPLRGQPLAVVRNRCEYVLRPAVLPNPALHPTGIASRPRRFATCSRSGPRALGPCAASPYAPSSVFTRGLLREWDLRPELSGPPRRRRPKNSRRRR